MLKPVNPKITEKVGDYYLQIWLCGNAEHKPPHVKLLHTIDNSLKDDSRLSRELGAEILSVIKDGEKKIGDMFCINEIFRDEVKKLLPEQELFSVV